MKVIFAGTTYDCTRAVKAGDSAILSLIDGGRVEFSGVSDFAGFRFEGGEWVIPAPTPEEQLRADVDFLAVMGGVTL